MNDLPLHESNLGRVTDLDLVVEDNASININCNYIKLNFDNIYDK